MGSDIRDDPEMKGEFRCGLCQKGKLDAYRYQPDTEADACELKYSDCVASKSWPLSLRPKYRKHHCRRCKRVVCDKCCPLTGGTRICRKGCDFVDRYEARRRLAEVPSPASARNREHRL